MGSAKWNKVIADAEKVLSSRKWDERIIRYTIKSHISKLRQAYNDLMRASQHISYVPPNGTCRARYLLEGDQSTNPTICFAKTTILADIVKKNDFEQAASFIAIIAPMKLPTHRPGQRIEAVNFKRNGPKRGKIHIGPKTAVELSFYERGEWMKLSSRQTMLRCTVSSLSTLPEHLK